MNQFDIAKQKYERNRERQASTKALESTETPKKKEEPKKQGPMVVSIEGPVSLVFEVNYSGTLLASQTTPQALRESFIKQLSVFGRVTCR